MRLPSVAVVTGGTGFVGSRLVQALLRQGANVRLVSSGTVARDPTLERDERIIWFGLSDADLDQAVAGATHLFNFAVAYDRPAIDDATIAAVNVELPLRLIARLKRRDKPVSCILGDTFVRKFPPEATQQVRYTRSKTELVERLATFASDRSFRLALLQIEQVFGPGETFAKALPGVTRQMLASKPRIAMTTGAQSRDFVYVDDVVDAALVVAAAEWEGCVTVECGSGIATPVREVFEQLHRITQSASTLGFGDIKVEQSIATSVADLGWLREHGWAPRTSLHEGLKRLVDDVRLRTQVQ
jgi:nucleoside-diphosphate-sugar epimerase